MTRSHRDRLSAALTTALVLRGVAETVDFLLPLYAGLSLGANPTEVGILLAVEVGVSFLGRPLAGAWADRADRRRLAAAGAVAYGLACIGYAVAPGVVAAYGAAVVGGVGGALIWVSLRAMVGEEARKGPTAFARLTGAEETGGWVVFVPAIFLVMRVDYGPVLLALGACCLGAAGVIWSAAPARTSAAEAQRDADKPHQRQDRVARRLAPLLAAIAVVSLAEAAIALLLLLHLQRAFGLDVLQTALVFLPGAVVMGAVPPYLHTLTVRYGRRRMLSIASVSSAAFAAGLAFAPAPWVTAALWVLSGVAWAIVMPIQQAVVAEVSQPGRLGRGMGWYEASSLGGAALGLLTAGFA